MKQDVQKNKKRALFFRRLFLVILVLGLSAGGGVLFFDNYEIKERSGKVCGDDVIERFNKTYDNHKNYKEESEKVVTDIESKYGYKNDVNCLMIVYGVRGFSRDRYEDIKRFSDRGINPSLKIRSIQSLKYIEPIDL